MFKIALVKAGTDDRLLWATTDDREDLLGRIGVILDLFPDLRGLEIVIWKWEAEEKEVVRT